MKYRFLSPALVEITQAAEYYDHALQGLGVEFLDELDTAMERILQHPNAWQKVSNNFHQYTMQKFPFSIIYKIDDQQEIIVLSVFHQHRDSQEWRNLIAEDPADS